MNRSFHTYKIKLLQVEFSHNNIKFQKTAEISLFNNNNELIEKIKLAYIENNYIQKLFNSEKIINIDNCYIKDFQLPNEEKIKGIKISAENTFFDSPEKNINLSETIIFNDILNFKNATFICKEFNFHDIRLKIRELIFSNTLFICEKVNFSRMHLFNSDVSFKNAIFKGNCSKDFKDIKFGKGIKNFENIDFGKGDVSFSGTNFNNGKTSFKITEFGTGKVDFSRTKFGENETVFEKANFGNGETIFRTANFENGKVNFIGTRFGIGKKRFENTDFGNGNIVFKNASFNDGRVSFKASIFGEGIVDFHFSEFGKGDVIFDQAKFKDGGINFNAVNFGTGRVSFKKSRLGDGNILFENITLNGNFEIQDSVFGNGEFNMQYAELQNADVKITNVDFGIGKVSFFRSKFHELSLQGSQLDNFFDLRIESCKYLDLSDTVVKDIMDINPHGYDAKIENLNMAGMRLLGRLYLDWGKSNVKELIYKQDTKNITKEEQFRILKENYSVTGQYAYEDEAYVEFKRTEAKAIYEQKISKYKESRQIYKNKPFKRFLNSFNALKAMVAFFFNWLIFDKMGKYATDPVRVLITMVITYLGFTLLYVMLAEFGNVHILSSLFDPNDPAQAGKILSPIGKAFYHSSITFLTIGYGDYYPDGISRWISAFEGFVGLFQMSYFTVAFVRKVLR